MFGNTQVLKLEHLWMHEISLLKQILCRPVFTIHSGEVPVVAYSPFGESVWEGLLLTPFDLSSFLLHL